MAQSSIFFMKGKPVDFWHLPATISKNNFKNKSLSNCAFNISVGCWHGCRFFYVPSAATNKQAPELLKYDVEDPDRQWGDCILLKPWNQAEFFRTLRWAEWTPPTKLKADGNRTVISCSSTDPYQTLKARTPEKTKQVNRETLATVERALIAIIYPRIICATSGMRKTPAIINEC